MNSLLLWLGIFVALALTAAFAAPFFIDWSSQRDFFEAQASELVGRPVEFAGPLEVRLVPFPSLTAGDVRIGGAQAEESRVERIRMRAALAPLLSGQLHISELVLTRPTIAVTVGPDGSLTWGERIVSDSGGLPISAGNTVVDRLQVVDGAASIQDRRLGRTFSLSELNVEGTATTLAGPFRFEGGTLVDDERYTFRFATGRIDSGRFRVTAALQPAARPLAINLDGTIIAGDEMPAYQGALTIDRPPLGDGESRPWRLTGSISASPEEIVFQQLGLQLGPQDQRISLSGAANVALGETPRFDAVLSARQIDLDRTFGGGPDDPVTPTQALRRIAAGLDPAAFPIPGDMSVDIGSMVLAGNIVEGFAADIEVEGDSWNVVRAELAAPGGTDMALSGAISFAPPGPAFDGAIRVAARQSGVLATWLFGAQARLPGLGAVSGPLDASAIVHLGGGGFGLERLDIETEDTRLTGSIAYEPAGDDAPARLNAAIETDRFELAAPSPGDDAMLPLAALSRGLADTELELDLNARQLVFADLAAGGVELSAGVSGGDVRVERIAIRDFGGARLGGRGTLTDVAGTPEGTLSFDVETGDVGRLAEALGDLGLEAAAAQLAARGDVLSPLRLELALDAQRSERGSAGRLALSGRAGDSDVAATLEFDGRTDALPQMDVVVTAEASGDAASLAEQLGLDRGVAGAGSGRVSLAVNGRPGEGMPFLLVGEDIGIDGRIEGYARLAGDSAWELSGDVDVDLPRPGPILGMAGIALPEDDVAGVSVRGSLSILDAVWHASDIVLTTGRGQVRGALSVDLARGMRAVGGRLEADTLDLPWVLSVLLGPEAFETVDAAYGEPAWPQTPFEPVSREGWRGEVSVSAPTLALGGGYAASDASLRIGFDPERFSLTDIDSGWLGGRLGGDLEFVTVGGGVTAEARLELDDARLEDLVWRDQGRPVARGNFSASMEAEGAGRSVLGLVSTLTGNGSVELADAVVRRMNDRAFDRIVTAADGGMELTEEGVGDVFAGHLDSGSLTIDQAAGAVTVTAGVMRISNARLETEALDAFASATVDLTVMGLDSEWTLRVDTPEDDGRSREVGVVFAGPLAEPGREIDVTPLLGYLTVRSFEQEVERLEQLQSDILERQRFDRELRRLNEERRSRERAAEESDALAEEEARRQAEEEARRQAEEEARREAEAAARREAERRDAERARQEDERALRRMIEDALRNSGEPPSGVETRPLPAPGNAPLDIRPGG